MGKRKSKVTAPKKADNTENNPKLELWKSRLNIAMSEHDGFRGDCAVYDAQYHGTKVVAGAGGKLHMSDRYDDQDQSVTQNARQVVPLTFQLIESQVDPTVPMPSVNPTENQDDGESKQMLEGMLEYMAEGPELERINSENERIVKKSGLCCYKVTYNPGFAAHKFRGRIETYNPHPVNIIPQPGVNRVEDMDYLFHIENRTIDYICRRYGEEFREELDGESAQYANLEDLSGTSTTSAQQRSNWLSLVECWYKDKDGDICLLTWVGETLLRDKPKFFYKRDAAGEIIEFEDVEREIVDEQGNVTDTEVVKVRCHIPKRFPFVVQYNIPREKSFYGKADPEIIFDQQEAIKKVLSIEEEKLIRGTTKILVRKGNGLAKKLTSKGAVSQVEETDDPMTDARVIDMKTPDNSLKDYYGLMLQAAKDALGVTEASQGRADSSSLSGRALELLANNAAGRISTKLFEKHISFTELYQLYYDFLLAYYDEKRPFRTEGPDNKPIYGYFDKSKLIRQDDAGEWYYPDWDIKIHPDTGLPKDKRFVLDAANNAVGKVMDPIEYWTVLESIGFPNATAILEMERKKQQQPQPQPGMIPPGGGATPPQPQTAPEQGQGQVPPAVMQLLQQLPPEDLQTFMESPPEVQQQLLAQLMGGSQQ